MDPRNVIIKRGRKEASVLHTSKLVRFKEALKSLYMYMERYVVLFNKTAFEFLLNAMAAIQQF